MFVHGKETSKFIADNKNVNFPTQFCLRSISNGFSATESREVSLNGNVYDFSVDYNSIDKSDILNIMFGLFIVLLGFSKSLACDGTKCLFLNDEPYMQPTLNNMNPFERKYYPSMISLNKCSGSCNVLSPKICLPKETEIC